MKKIVLIVVMFLLALSAEARTVKYGDIGSYSNIDTASAIQIQVIPYIPCDTTVFIFEVRDTVTVDYLVVLSYAPNGTLATTDTLYSSQTINNKVQLVGGYTYPRHKVYTNQKVMIKYKGKTKGKGIMKVTLAYIKENGYE